MDSPQIVEISKGEVIATYLVFLKVTNYIPSAQEYFNEAWRCAVADCHVSIEDKENYSFNFAP